MKVLVIAPHYEPGRGPSNALYFLKYVNGIKLLFYSDYPLFEDRVTGVKLLRSLNANHYILSHIVRRIAEKFGPDYIISIAPELMLRLKEKELERSVVILQGFIEVVQIKHEPVIIRVLPVYPEIVDVSKRIGGYAAISMYMYRRISTFFKPKRIELVYNPVREMFFKLGHERVQRDNC
jgi:hypothetical protein